MHRKLFGWVDGDGVAKNGIKNAVNNLYGSTIWLAGRRRGFWGL